MSFLPDLPPIHPGRIFRNYILPARKATIAEAADAMDVRLQFLEAFVNERARIDADFADKLYYYTECSARTWIGLQENFDRAVGMGKTHVPYSPGPQP